MKVIVVAKSPQPGRVKTRLCPPLDPEQAACVAEAALADTLDAVAACGADEFWLALEGTAGPWLPEGFRVVAQRGDSLGARLAHAWARVGGPALQIGMDTPQVTPDLLADGCHLLAASNEPVLGMAVDGGWWALGLVRPDERVFHGVPWSTPHTGAMQRQRMESLGLRPRLLPVLRDVDVWEDALCVAAAFPHGRFADAVGRCAQVPSDPASSSRGVPTPPPMGRHR